MGFSLSSSLLGASKLAGDAADAVTEETIDLLPVYPEEITVRVEIRDAAGSLTGYDDVTSGLGYTYTTHYDADQNYLGDDYAEGSGYRSSTTQTVQKNIAGAIIGYTITSSGGDGSYEYASTSTYDADWNMLTSSYSDSDGYVSIYAETAQYDAAGTLTGYSTVGSGQGEWGSYSSTEVLDADHNLVSSEYSDSSGYHSTYLMETQYDSGGKISGYVVTSSWSYGEEGYSTKDYYDAGWSWLSGDAPPIIIDDGPAILPVVKLASDDLAELATGNMSAAGDEAVVADTAGSKDVLKGSAGDDVFVISDPSDRIARQGWGGMDTVASSTLDIDLGKRSLKGIENAGLLGADDLDLTGDGWANVLSGNAGDNLLAGKRGADTLFGGAGSDVFLLDKFNLRQIDTITDFTIGTDTIGLSKKKFSDLMGDDGTLATDVWGDTLRFDADSGALILDTPKGEITIALIANVGDLGADSFGFF